MQSNNTPKGGNTPAASTGGTTATTNGASGGCMTCPATSATSNTTTTTTPNASSLRAAGVEGGAGATSMQNLAAKKPKEIWEYPSRPQPVVKADTRPEFQKIDDQKYTEEKEWSTPRAVAANLLESANIIGAGMDVNSSVQDGTDRKGRPMTVEQSLVKFTSTALVYTPLKFAPAGAGNSTPLYRAVFDAELDDIVANGIRTAPETGYEGGKLFATTPLDAANYGKILFKFEKTPFTIIETSIPNRYIPMLEAREMDLMKAIEVPSDMLNQLSTPNILNNTRIPIHPWLK